MAEQVIEGLGDTGKPTDAAGDQGRHLWAAPDDTLGLCCRMGREVLAQMGCAVLFKAGVPGWAHT